METRARKTVSDFCSHLLRELSWKRAHWSSEGCVVGRVEKRLSRGRPTCCLLKVTERLVCLVDDSVKIFVNEVHNL